MKRRESELAKIVRKRLDMLALDMPSEIAAVLHAEAKAMSNVVDEFLKMMKRKDEPMASIDDKKDYVIEQIDELFGDTSVSKRATLDALEEIQSDLESKIDALEADIKSDEEIDD